MTAVASRVATAAYRPWLLRLVQLISYGIFRVALRLQVSGLEHVPSSGPLLIAGNHAGFLDGPLVVAAAPRPVRALAKSELYHGALGRALLILGQIPVRRGRPDRTALTAAAEELVGGGAVGMFPEGTRGTGELEEVQHGVAYLAVRTGAPIVPVACLGTAEAMPKGRHLPKWRAPVLLVFGPAFSITPPANPRARSAVAAAAEEIRVELAAHLARARGEIR
ncbi:MAG: lysophospholipid acyltransferase family protein [Mycobacteriales bacterium]